MADSETSLIRLNKDDFIRLTLDQQKKLHYFWQITKELTELCQSYTKLESDLTITKAVKLSFKNQIIMLERQCLNNAQYFNRETLEIFRIPENIDNGELEGKVLPVFSKPNLSID